MAKTSTFVKSKEALLKKLTWNVNTALEFIKNEAEDRTPEDKKY